MPLRSVIVVFLRLFAIQFLFSFFVSILGFFRYSPISVSIVGAIIWLGGFGVAWLFAPQLACFVTKGYDAPVNLGGLTRQDLYCFVFVFVGAECFIGGTAFCMMHLNTIFADKLSSSASSFPSPPATQAINQLPQDLGRLILGLIVLLNANRFAKKLVSREESF